MNPFDEYLSKLEDLLVELKSAPMQMMSQTKEFPVTPGCYAISEDGEYVYVGIAKNIRRRIRNHIAGRANQSAFAFRLARTETGAVVAYRREGSRAQLMTRPDFVAAMQRATQKIRAMSAQSVHIADPSLLYLFEFYAAKCLNTRYNSFNVH